jgi:hypothetical protein
MEEREGRPVGETAGIASKATCMESVAAHWQQQQRTDQHPDGGPGYLFRSGEERERRARGGWAPNERRLTLGRRRRRRRRRREKKQKQKKKKKKKGRQRNDGYGYGRKEQEQGKKEQEQGKKGISCNYPKPERKVKSRCAICIVYVHVKMYCLHF